MRICYLGDANVQVRRVSEHFAAAGHEVHLVTARPGRIEGVTVHPFCGPIARGRAAFLLGVPAARRLVGRIAPDLVHVFYATSYGAVSSLIPGPPVALSPMGTDVLISARQSRLSAAMVRRAIARAAIIFSVAPHMTRRLVDLGADPGRILTFPRGVDLERFPLRPRHPAPDAPVILSNRKLEPVYNIEQLIRAMPIVLGRCPGARLILYGDGSQRGRLEAMAAAEGIAGGVRFAGAIDHDRVAGALAAADIYVSCSRSDGASVSLLEAMASGLYPVVSDIEANRPWIDGTNGELVPLDDPQALAGAIVRAVSGLDRRGESIQRNRALIEERASWRLNMPRIERAYADLLRNVRIVSQ